MNIPAIRPEWRTPTVVALCQGMREAQDFGAMPILADALQDAGCDDEVLLAQLRGTQRELGADITAVAAIMSEESRDAVQWVVDFASSFRGNNWAATYPGSKDWTFNEIMHAAVMYLRFGTSLTGGAEMEGQHVPDEFWDKYQLITGEQLPKWKRGNFFSCSC